MSGKMEEALLALAGKIGSTTEHMWGVMVRQAYITASVDIVLVLMLVIVTMLLWREHRRWAEQVKERYADDMPIFGILACIAAVTVLISLGALLPEIVTCFANPEYQALQKLLRAVPCSG